MGERRLPFVVGHERIEIKLTLATLLLELLIRLDERADHASSSVLDPSGTDVDSSVGWIFVHATLDKAPHPMHHTRHGHMKEMQITPTVEKKAC